MIKKFLLAAVLTCCISTTYAAERPSEFARLTSGEITTACALQTLDVAYGIKKNGGLLEPGKSRLLHSTLQLHLVWFRITDPSQNEIEIASKRLSSETPEARQEIGRYCFREASDMFLALSPEAQNHISSQGLDLEKQLFPE